MKCIQTEEERSSGCEAKLIHAGMFSFFRISSVVEHTGHATVLLVNRGGYPFEDSDKAGPEIAPLVCEV